MANRIKVWRCKYVSVSSVKLPASEHSVVDLCLHKFCMCHYTVQPVRIKIGRLYMTNLLGHGVSSPIFLVLYKHLRRKQNWVNSRKEVCHRHRSVGNLPGLGPFNMCRRQLAIHVAQSLNQITFKARGRLALRSTSVPQGRVLSCSWTTCMPRFVSRQSPCCVTCRHAIILPTPCEESREG